MALRRKYQSLTLKYQSLSITYVENINHSSLVLRNDDLQFGFSII